jgi:hypothetical protein
MNLRTQINQSAHGRPAMKILKNILTGIAIALFVVGLFFMVKNGAAGGGFGCH